MNQKEIKAELDRLGVDHKGVTGGALKQLLDDENAIVNNLKKQLDKFEIAYGENLSKDALREILDSELEERAKGENDDDAAVATIEDTAEDAEPELSPEERKARIEELAAQIDEGDKAVREGSAVLAKLRSEHAKLLQPTKQASLADCNRAFQDGVRRQAAVKAESQRIMDRSVKEAEKLLDETSE